VTAANPWQTDLIQSRSGVRPRSVPLAVLGMAPFCALLGGRAAAALGHPADPMVGASRTLLIAGIILLATAVVYLTQLPAMRRAARPVYVEKGILPAIAQGLQTADDEMPGGGER
jgi:hypothetical protein